MGDWVIDTDPGIDDSFAITHSINILKDHLKLISITGGNNGVKQCVINAKKICVINERKYNISQGDHFSSFCVRRICRTQKLRKTSKIHR